MDNALFINLSNNYFENDPRFVDFPILYKSLFIFNILFFKDFIYLIKFLFFTFKCSKDDSAFIDNFKSFFFFF